MAGAGYKVFADGDVLTAAQVQTYLQDQAVMRFADSSARTTGLGTAVAEGMVSYLQDTDAVEVYDGSAWVSVAPPASPLVAVAYVEKTDTQDASLAAGATLDIAETGGTATMTLSHAMSDAGNDLYLFVNGNGVSGAYSASSFKVYANGTAVESFTTAGSRTELFGQGYQANYTRAPGLASGVLRFQPGTTASIDYTLKFLNTDASTRGVHINRGDTDTDAQQHIRTVTSLLLWEVKP